MVRVDIGDSGAFKNVTLVYHVKTHCPFMSLLLHCMADFLKESYRISVNTLAFPLKIR